MLMWLGLSAGCDKKFSLVVTNASDRDVEVKLLGPGEIRPDDDLIAQANNQVRFNVKVDKKLLPTIYQLKFDDYIETVHVTSKTDKVIYRDIDLDGQIRSRPKDVEVHQRRQKEAQDIPVYQGPVPK